VMILYVPLLLLNASSKYFQPLSGYCHGRF